MLPAERLEPPWHVHVTQLRSPPCQARLDLLVVWEHAHQSACSSKVVSLMHTDMHMLMSTRRKGKERGDHRQVSCLKESAV